MTPGLDPNEALGLVNEYRSSKGPACPFLGKPCHGGGGNSRQRHGQPRPACLTLGPNGADLQKRLTMSGYRFKVAAENVSVGQRSFAQIVEGWKQSPPHSRNMLLAEAKHMGIAYEYKPDTKYKTYWTLVVAAP